MLSNLELLAALASTVFEAIPTLIIVSILILTATHTRKVRG